MKLLTVKQMNKLITLDKATIKALSHKAIEAGMSLKKYIESELVKIAKNGTPKH